ncbi:MAG: YidH family protein [Deltaproteobacteria bacterium]
MPGPNVSDHQANERTFLAWLRTAIALMGFGFVVSKFGLFLRVVSQARHVPHESSSALVGIGLVILGGVTAGAAGFRYRLLRRRIDLGTYSPAGWPILATSLSLALLAGLLVAFLVEAGLS